MAQIDIGKLSIGPHKGDYNNSTAYVANDIVYYNGSAYIAKQSTTGNLPTDTNNWNTFSAGSGGIWNSGLSLGTAGQVVKVNSGATALEFGTVSTGAYSIGDIQRGEISAQTHAGSTSTSYAFGPTLTTTPVASTDLIELKMTTCIEAQQSSYYGFAIGVNTSDSWTSSTTDAILRLNEGEHSRGMGSGHDSERYQQWSYGGIFNLTELNMTAGTQYYLKCHVHAHNPGGQIKTGFTSSNQNDRVNNFSLIRYKV